MQLILNYAFLMWVREARLNLPFNEPGIESKGTLHSMTSRGKKGEGRRFIEGMLNSDYVNRECKYENNTRNPAIR